MTPSFLSAKVIFFSLLVLVVVVAALVYRSTDDDAVETSNTDSPDSAQTGSINHVSSEDSEYMRQNTGYDNSSTKAHTSSRTPTDDSLFKEAMDYKRKGDAGAALERLKRISAAEPENAVVLAEIGDIFLKSLNKPEKAADWYEKALSLDTGNGNIAFNLVKSYLAAKKLERGRKFLNGLLSREPGSYILNYAMGDLLSAGGKPADALQYFLVSEDISGRSPQAVSAVGDTYLAMKEYEKAIDYLEISVSHQAGALKSGDSVPGMEDPKTRERFLLTRMNLTLACMLSGKLERASEMLDELERENPGNDLLGKLREKLKEQSNE